VARNDCYAAWNEIVYLLYGPGDTLLTFVIQSDLELTIKAQSDSNMGNVFFFGSCLIGLNSDFRSGLEIPILCLNLSIILFSIPIS